MFPFYSAILILILLYSFKSQLLYSDRKDIEEVLIKLDDMNTYPTVHVPNVQSCKPHVLGLHHLDLEIYKYLTHNDTGL